MGNGLNKERTGTSTFQGCHQLSKYGSKQRPNGNRFLSINHQKCGSDGLKFPNFFEKTMDCLILLLYFSKVFCSYEAKNSFLGCGTYSGRVYQLFVTLQLKKIWPEIRHGLIAPMVGKITQTPNNEKMLHFSYNPSSFCFPCYQFSGIIYVIK